MSHKQHTSTIDPEDHYVILRVRPKDYQISSARYRWHCRAREFHGKTLAAFKQSVLTAPPSLPASGVPEKVAGWLHFLVDDEHVVELRELKPPTRKV